MKAKRIVLSCLLGAIIFFTLGFEHSWAAGKLSKSATRDLETPKVAVVSIRQIFANSKRNTDYREKVIAQEDKVKAQLIELSKEIEAVRAEMNTRKVGSVDYLTLMQQAMEKQSKFQTKKEFYEQQRALKDQQWTEKLYKEILQSTAAVAKKKGVEMVFAKDEVDLPAASPTELMLNIRLNKLLYSTDGLDITKEVLVELDKKSKK